jgi:hypothetical protein
MCLLFSAMENDRTKNASPDHSPIAELKLGATSSAAFREWRMSPLFSVPAVFRPPLFSVMYIKRVLPAGASTRAAYLT